MLLLACGGASPAAAPATVASSAPPPAATATATGASTATTSATTKAPPGRLGHYSSGDGMVGFVFDRTGATMKLRLDGTTDVIDLEVQAHTEDHTDLVHRKANVFVRVESNGRVTFVRGNQSLPMKRDADADPLSGPPPAAAASTATASTVIPKLRLGHYSSGDGMTGFVLDRTGKKPRMRMDGTKEIVEMDPEPAPRNETALTVHLRGVVMRLGEHGEVTFFRGNEAISMHRDADAEPLQ